MCRTLVPVHQEYGSCSTGLWFLFTRNELLGLWFLVPGLSFLLAGLSFLFGHILNSLEDGHAITITMNQAGLILSYCRELKEEKNKK